MERFNKIDGNKFGRVNAKQVKKQLRHDECCRAKLCKQHEQHETHQQHEKPTQKIN